jgi:hypothetical protein
MNFRAKAEMLVLFPSRAITADQDLTMPKRDWSRYDAPPDEVRKANVARWKMDRDRRGR